MGHVILKLVMNVEMFIYFFVYSLIKEEDEPLCNFHNEITQPFLNLEGAAKCVLQQHQKNTTAKIVQYSTPISTIDTKMT